MNNVMFLLFRRLRTPMVVMICTYAVVILGLVLIPGVDDQGRPWHMDFFHAFYFVSFMGSTIGFGEIPYTFTDAQRMWTLFGIYATVISWLYGIGAALAIVQDPAFRRVVKENAFSRAVRRINDPFYLICGYGDTGSQVVEALVERGIHAVVIDIQQSRIDSLETAGLEMEVPALCADAADPHVLQMAGMRHPCCRGLVALTNNDQANLTIAVSSKLMAPDIKAVCRAELAETEANMESFGTDHVINPFDTFADRFAMAIHCPAMYYIYEWMTRVDDKVTRDMVTPPRGRWIVCGYGRFGRALQKYLAYQGLETAIIEAMPEKTAAPPEAIIGKGTEAVTLREARVDQACGIVAGTDNGADNLSIILTARDLNASLYTVVRQTRGREQPIFDMAHADMVIQPSEIIARKVLAFLRNPLLADFLRLARREDEAWAMSLMERIVELVEGRPLESWIIQVDQANAPALDYYLRKGEAVSVGTICHDPRKREEKLALLPLMIKRGEDYLLLPAESERLRRGDWLLLGGRVESKDLIEWSICNHNRLSYLLFGVERASGSLWRWLSRRRA